ncbi:MAG: hypothetical protein IPL35_17835 [Sphingobacteriales bacterium]|nr:hypothetical protein [Sphingobacteriales bacterium]
MDFNDSWLGTYGVDMTAVYRHFPTSTTTGYGEVAITRLNRQNRVGSGKICTAIAEVDLAGAADEQSIYFTLEEQQMVVAEGYFIPVGILGNMGGNTSRFALYNLATILPCQSKISLSGILTNGIVTYQTSVSIISIQKIKSGVTQVLSRKKLF